MNIVIQFAHDELERYLRAMCGKDSLFEIKLGLLDDIGIRSLGVIDPRLDDEIYGRVVNGKGFLAGNSPRSVLLAVYSFLERMGCGWVSPGKDGEYIPVRRPEDLSAEFHEKASYRHRCICIEGANSIKQILEYIDWLPKLGMNAYFMQFDNGYVFFRRWYEAHGHSFTPEQADEATVRIEEVIQQRGLLYHKMGHGWTAQALGGQSLGWQTANRPIAHELLGWTAKVNGKRRWWNNVPDNTNLCYGNPDAREHLIQQVVTYAKTHPQVDFLHFWMADECNNQCECNLCRSTSPSDFYVEMLNEIDCRLSRDGIPTRLAFVVYFENMFPPQTERFNSTDRFVLTFAPITREYEHTFLQPVKDPGLTYQRNKMRFPKDVGENLFFLQQWQKIFPGDSADYDYHLLWAYSCELGRFHLAHVLCEDIRSLKRAGLNGYISCQIQRAFLPTAWCNYLMAKTLWSDSCDEETLKERYFGMCFGEGAKQAVQFLQELSELVRFDWLVDQQLLDRPYDEGRIQSTKELITGFNGLARNNLLIDAPLCQKQNWQSMVWYCELCTLLLNIRSAQESSQRTEAIRQAEAYLMEQDALAERFDSSLLLDMLRKGNAFLATKTIS